jgi:hypothetical protein
VDFERVASILRLSTKYEMATFREQCILELKGLYPSSLEEFDVVYGSCGAPWTFETKDCQAATLFKAIQLAREMNVLEILPCAFYFCTQLSTSVILTAPSDSTACLIGRDTLQKMQDEQTYSFVHHFTASDGCRSGCTRQMDQLVAPFYTAKNKWTTLNPFTLELADFSMYHGSVCDNCFKAMKEGQTSARRKVWATLPGIFGLGTWEELRAAQNV